MRVLSLFTLALSTHAVWSAAIPPATHVVHEKRHVPTARRTQWMKRHRIDSRALLPMRIGLTQQNLHKGHELLMDV
jgi:tripeptidyl-peptidase-1